MLPEVGQVPDGGLEGGIVGIDGPDHGLVAKDNVTHELVRIDLNGVAGSRNSGKDIHTVDSEDTKDASRSTGNLWDLEEFKKTYEAAGIEVQTDKFEGGHEMPTTKHGSSRALFKRFYEFIIRNDGKPFPSEVF